MRKPEMRSLKHRPMNTASTLLVLAATLVAAASAAQTPAPPASETSPPAAGSPSAESSENDPRLQQKVVVHANWQRIEDLLAWLTQATGVTLMARMEVADEAVTVWAD